MLTKLYNDISFHPYQSFYNPISYETDSIWPFDDFSEVLEDDVSYMEHLERARRQQLVEEEIRRRTKERIFMEELKKIELEKAKRRRKTEEQRQIRLLQNMLLEEKRQREIDRKHYEKAMAKSKAIESKQILGKPRPVFSGQDWYRCHPSHSTVMEEEPETGNHIFFLGPKPNSEMHNNSNSSRPHIRPKVVRINPNNLHGIRTHVEPLVRDPEESKTVDQESNSAHPNHGYAQIHINMPTTINQGHKAEVKDRGTNMELDSTPEPKFTKRKVVPIVSKKKKIKYAGLIGDVEDASDSECEDEYSDYIHNRRPAKGQWIEPVESIQTIVF